MATSERARVLEALRRYGWNATSFQVLEPGFEYAFDGDGEDAACVAYVDTGAAWVAAGAPLAPDERLAEVAAWFVARARKRGRRACFFAAEQRFCERSAGTLRTFRIGEQPAWRPSEWTESLRTPSAKSLREQLRRARAKGVVVRRLSAEELADPSSEARAAIATLVTRWLGTRPMAPMGFLVGVEPFAFASERRTFLAEIRGASGAPRAVAFLAAVPVYQRRGWLFEDLLRAPEAPNGTAELLVDAAMRAVAEEGAEFATLGLAPLAGLVPRWMQLLGSVGAALYDFRGVHAFKAKLRPARWDAAYLAHTRHVPPLVAVLDSLAAFARGSLPRFALETVLRGPPLVVRALGAALVPWTIALALADDRHWFPASGVKIGWIAFDVTLAIGMLALASRWRTWLATVLASAISLDAVLTLAEAMTYNAPRLASARDAVAVVIACVGPALAALVLWRAIGRMRALEATG